MKENLILPLMICLIKNYIPFEKIVLKAKKEPYFDKVFDEKVFKMDISEIVNIGVENLKVSKDCDLNRLNIIFSKFIGSKIIENIYYRLSDEHQSIINLRYIFNRKVGYVCDDMYMSKSTYYRMLVKTFETMCEIFIEEKYYLLFDYEFSDIQSYKYIDRKIVSEAKKFYKSDTIPLIKVKKFKYENYK